MWQQPSPVFYNAWSHFKEPAMPYLFKPLLSFILFAAWLHAVPVPKAVDDRALNLEHYLEYRMQNKVDFSCKERTDGFVCSSTKQKIVNSDENATTVTAFEKARVRFNAALALRLQKETFDATMKETEQIERLRRQYLASKKPYLAPPSSPLKDALERALVGNLEAVNITGFSMQRDLPRTAFSIEELAFLNDMKRTAKGAAFTERILGEMRLDYRGALLETNTSDAFYSMVPAMIEAWFDTNDTARADYVGKKLSSLYAEQLRSPFSGTMAVKTSYEGNDTISVEIRTKNRNEKGAQDSFEFSGELRNASTIFTPARKPLTPGTPDFLFKSMHSYSSADGSGYRDLLKRDKRFAAYIGAYDALFRTYFDQKLKKYRYSAVLVKWFSQAKTAASKLLTGKADTVEISVKNRDGVTAMQVFGMLMSQLMAIPQSPAQDRDGEKIVADTAASHLEIDIEAR
jgi:hypothetical protein